MDYELLESEAKRSLQRLPNELLTAIGRTVVAHKDAIIAEFPNIIEDLKPHAMAAIMEGATGILDKDELEATLMRVLASFGLELPQPSST